MRIGMIKFETKKLRKDGEVILKIIVLVKDWVTLSFKIRI